MRTQFFFFHSSKIWAKIRNSIEKPLYKEKLRLRTYGDTKDNTNAFIEIKKKYEGIVYTRRISGRYDLMHDYLKGDDKDIGDSQIAKEIASFMIQYQDLLPAMSICYDRLAMAGKEDKDFRVTFDSNIEWNDKCKDLRDIGTGKQILKPGQYLMEIKVSNAMPIALAAKLSELEIFPTSFSKYGAGYTDMITSMTSFKKVMIPERTKASARMKGEVAYV